MPHDSSRVKVSKGDSATQSRAVHNGCMSKQESQHRYQQRYQNAIDFIEENLVTPLSVEGIAERAHLSTFHFARVFRALTGLTVMEYARRRRLARAVLMLRMHDLQPLLDIALSVGFDSQQGFTNAFRKQFGITPGNYRKQRFALPIQEKLDMTNTEVRRPRGPDYRSREAFHIAGMAERYTIDTRVEIPQLWLRFAPRIGSVPNQVGWTTYGACIDTPSDDGAFTYMAAVEVASTDGQTDLEHHLIPAADYAVFTHEGSLDHIGDTMSYIFGEWLETSGHELNGTPDFELYDERFNPETGSGEFEIWVPIKRS